MSGTRQMRLVQQPPKQASEPTVLLRAVDAKVLPETAVVLGPLLSGSQGERIDWQGARGRSLLPLSPQGHAGRTEAER